MKIRFINVNGDVSYAYETTKSVTVWTDSIACVDCEEFKDDIKVLFVFEPQGIYDLKTSHIISKANKFNYIFTYYPELLVLKNAYLYTPLIGSVWVTPTNKDVKK